MREVKDLLTFSSSAIFPALYGAVELWGVDDLRNQRQVYPEQEGTSSLNRVIIRLASLVLSFQHLTYHLLHRPDSSFVNSSKASIIIPPTSVTLLSRVMISLVSVLYSV